MNRSQAKHEIQEQRSKLANSYQSLLNDFSSSELHTVGNYTVGRLIGKGSFGKVYLATHKLTNGSKVVLKSAKKEDANLAREIHHHRQFLHPHIARLYEVIVTESLVWLVLEYCPGDELYNHLLQHGRLAPAKAQRIFTQLVGAVSYVHAKGCVHRDLKLENILLDKHGSVKLVDFGFTREYQGTTSYLQTWCGTICYSAPEMLKGEKYAGEKVDVWSLGIILYALLCGELPFDEDDDAATKAKILRNEPNWREYIPEPAKELIQKMLSKRPLLRPTLADILKDPWLVEYAPQQQEILKIQQPAAFSTQVEKETLERMRSAGVDIDMVIENVLSQRCDCLAGWWALLIEKQQRKEKRREMKRKEREVEAKALRRLSAASGRLLALDEIHEDVEAGVRRNFSARGRRLSRTNGSITQVPDLPKVSEANTPTGAASELSSAGVDHLPRNSRSQSRPVPPPKDRALQPPVRVRNQSRGSGSILRYSTLNPDLLGRPTIPPPQRKRVKFSPRPLSKQIAWVKHLFREGAKRAKSPAATGGQKSDEQVNAKDQTVMSSAREVDALLGTRSGNKDPRPTNVQGRPELQMRTLMPNRPRIDTTSSVGSGTSVRAKRSSLSPGTLTPHSSFRRASGLRGRKSTSSSVSSIRTAYHQHSHSKASSTSSASLVSPSGLSAASGSRLARASPHSSVKVLPSTPTGGGSIPSGIRVSRRPPSGIMGPQSGLGEAKLAFSGVVPGSPSVPVFARRKRSVFKGPGNTGRINGGGSRSGSIQGRRSGEIIHGITEEDEDMEEIDDDEEMEMEMEEAEPYDEVDAAPPNQEKVEMVHEDQTAGNDEVQMRLTAAALVKMAAEQG